jgi:hypothetical protein
MFDRSGDDVRQNFMCRSATDYGRCYCGKIAVPTRDRTAAPEATS